VGHDNALFGLLPAIGAANASWPTFGATISFELWALSSLPSSYACARLRRTTPRGRCAASRRERLQRSACDLRGSRGSCAPLDLPVLGRYGVRVVYRAEPLRIGTCTPRDAQACPDAAT
jgi:hypothetical protein